MKKYSIPQTEEVILDAETLMLDTESGSGTQSVDLPGHPGVNSAPGRKTILSSNGKVF